MAISEFELYRIKRGVEAYVERKRPPAHLRDRLDLAYRVKGQSVFPFEVRPDWRGGPEKMESPVVKATWIKTRKHWRVYWMRKDLRWHSYDPDPVAGTIDEVLALVERDEWGCFFG